MLEFRKELLEKLLAHPEEFIDIADLINKVCGEDNTFLINDQQLLKCRLNINSVLRELKDMKWILMQPSGGLSMIHKLNQETNRRYFPEFNQVKVKFTLKGKMEYEESKQILSKKNLNVNKWVLLLTAMGIIITIIIYFRTRQ